MNDDNRTPFYDLTTAAKILADIFITYDLAGYIADDANASAEQIADYHIANTAAHDIRALIASQSEAQS